MASALSTSWKKEEEEEKHRQLEELRHIYELQESATRYFEKIATWLSIGYVIFGAILYNTIITQESSNAANDHVLGRSRWIPLSLSLSVSIAFWLQLVRSIQKYIKISNQSDISWMEQQRMHDLIFMDQDGQTGVQLCGNRTHKRRRNWMLNQRCIYISAVVSALIIYTLVVLHACISFSLME